MSNNYFHFSRLRFITKIRYQFLIAICAIQFSFLFFLDTVFANPPPCNATFSIPSSPICANSSLVFNNTSNGNADSCIWKWGDASPNTKFTGTSSDTNATHTFTLAGTYLVCLIRHVNSCVDSTCHQVVISSVPIANFSFTPNNACGSIPIQFTNTSTPAVGLTYSWNFGDTATNTSTLKNPTHTFNAFGSGSQIYNVSLTVINGAGCTNTIVKPVTIIRKPHASVADFISVPPFTNCVQAGGAPSYILTIDNTSLTNATNTNYTIIWGDSSANYSSSTFVTSITHTYNTFGYFTLKAIVSGPGGCTDTASYQIFNGSNPAVSLGNPGSTSGCAPSTYTFPVGYNDAFGNQNPPGTIYTITYNDGSPTTTYIQPFPPQLPPSTITHTFSLTSCGTSSTSGATTFANSFQVSITAQNPCGQSGASVTPINISTKPIADFSMSDTSVCINNTITFTNTSTNGSFVNTGNFSCSNTSKSNWLISPLTGWTVSSGTLGSNPPTNNPATWGSTSMGVTFTQAGTYYITQIGGNVCGNDSITRSVCILSPPTPSFTATPLTGCAPLVVNFNNTSIGMNQCDSIIRLWNVVKTSSTCTADSTNDFVFISGTDAGSLNPVIQFNNQGIYNVTLSLTNKCGTFTSAPVTITVKRKPQVTISVPPNICLGQTISPVANTWVCGDSIPLVYSWSFPGGIPNSSSQQNPTPISYATAGTKNISLTVRNGCGTTAVNSSVNILTAPVANAGTDKLFCSGGSSSLGIAPIAGLTYQWAPTTGLSSDTVSNPTVTLTNTGATQDSITYVLTVTNAANCSTRDTVKVKVNPQPNVIVNSPTICFGQTTTLTASGANTYVWSNAATTNQIIVNPTVTTNYSVVGIITLTGCRDTTTSIVTVNQLPLVDAGPSIILCNQPIPYTLMGFSPSGGTWSGSGVTAGGVFIPSIVGNFILTYSFTDIVTGCSNSDTMVVTVNAPQIANAGTGFNICLNTPAVTLSGFSPPGGTWSGSGISGNTFDPAIAGVGSFILSYTYGTGTCLSSDTIMVNVNSLPVVTVNSPTICNGQAATLTAAGANTYVWSNAATTNPIAVSPALTSNYTVTGTNTITGCSNTATSIVTVNPLPIVNAGQSIVLCNQPIPDTLTGFSPSGGTWSGSGVTLAGIFTPSAIGNFILTYSFIDVVTGCSNSDTMVVTVVAPQIANAGSGFSICLNNPTVTLSGFSPPGGTWSGSGIVGNTFDPSVSGVGTHVLTYTFGTGTCLTSDTIHVTVKPLPTVFVNSPTICNGQSATLTATGANTYSWSNSATTNPILVNPTTSTNYIVTGTATATGCFDTATSIVTVNPLPIVNAGQSITLCNQPIPYTLTGFSPTGGTWSGTGVNVAGVFTPSATGNFILTYSFTDAITSCSNADTLIVTVIAPQIANAGTGFSICLNNPTVILSGFSPLGGTWSGSGITGNSFSPSIAGTGSHVLTYTFGTGTCLTSDTITVIVKSLPVVMVGSNQSVCQNQGLITLSGFSPAGGIWSGNSVNTGGIFNPAIAGLGTHTLIYSFTSVVTGCSASDSLDILVNPIPVVNAGPNEIFCSANTNILLAAPSPSGGQWSGPGITNSSSGLFNPSLAGLGNHILTYTYIDVHGCSDSSTKSVTVNAPLPVSAGINDTICLNNGILTLTGFSPAGGSWSGSGITNPSGIFNPLIATPGTHTLTYSIGTGTCTNTSQKNVVVHPLPLVSAGNPRAICYDNGPIMLSGFTPASGGIWSGNGIVNSSQPLFDPHLSGVGNHTILYSYVDQSTGCSDTGHVIITVNPTPVALFTFPTLVCKNFSNPLINLSSGGTTYHWNFGDSTTSNSQNPTHVFTSTGTFIISLIVSNGSGCDSLFSTTVAVIEPPSASFIKSTANGCGPLTVTFTDQSTGYLTGGSHFWDFGLGQQSGLPGPHTIVYPSGLISDTTYHISLIVSNQCGNSVFTDSVIVHPTPTTNFGTNVSSGCSPLTISFSNTTVGDPQNYYWILSNGNISTSANPGLQTYYAYTNDSIYTITLIASNSCGTDTIQKQLTVHPNTVHAFFNQSPAIGCVPLLVNFTNYSLGGTLFSSWDFGDTNISSASNPSHTYTQPGTYTVTLIVNNGCSFDTTNQQITVYPLPVVGFTMSTDSMCQGQTVQFSDTSINVNGITWNFGDSTTSTLSSPSHSYAQSGNYTISLTGTSAINGCQNTVTKNIVILQTPVASFTIPVMAGCQPFIASFNNTSINASYYLWDFGDGNTSLQPNPSHLFSGFGNYSVSLITSNSLNCFDTATGLVNVFQKPQSLFTVHLQDSCLVPASATFTNLSSGAVSYSWDLGNSTTSSLVNPTVTYNLFGSYTITLISSSIYSCADTSAHQVTINQPPVASFTVNNPIGCSPFTEFFTNASQNGVSYLWHFGDGSQISQADPSHQYVSPGIYNVTLITTGLGGCKDAFSISNGVTVLQSPNANFNYELENSVVNPSGIYQFTNLSTTLVGDSILKYEWNFGDDSTSTLKNPLHEFGQGVKSCVRLIATNSYNCPDTSIQCFDVELTGTLYVPNSLAPHDGCSEADETCYFIPKGVEIKSLLIEIFSPYGERVWFCDQVKDGHPDCKWDGTYGGKPLPQGAYYWKVSRIEFNSASLIWEGMKYPGDETGNKMGSVMLIR